MTQQYTPVTWQDETTSQQGTLINAERLNQMQTAHHYADGFEEVDAVPTADPSVAYHKIVYCTADSTFYRWDGTEWTKDIDDETKALLQQEIARATQADSQLNQRVDDEHDARVDAEAAIYDRITDEATELAQRITTEVSTRYTADTALGTRITNETSARETADTNLGNRITAEATARAEADTLLGGRIDTEQARAEAAEQANAQAIANTYTKAEADTLLAGKASTTAVQTLDTRVGALETGLADTYNKSQTDTLLAGKLDTLSTTGLHAYTHNGATQSEVAVIDGTTASTIPIRDTNGRLQANDPASGATDKSLVTANWISQTGNSAPNNLLHKNGDETKDGTLTLLKNANIRTSGVFIGGTNPLVNDHVSIRAMLKIKILYNVAVRFTVIGNANNQNFCYGDYVLTFSRSGSSPALYCLDRYYSNNNVKQQLYINIENDEVKIYGQSVQFCTMEVCCLNYYSFGQPYDPPEGYELMKADNVGEVVTLPDTAISAVMIAKE